MRPELIGRTFQTATLNCLRCDRAEAQEHCWRCAVKTLCVPCWDEYGCCEADEGTGYCVIPGGILVPTKAEVESLRLNQQSSEKNAEPS